MTESQSDFDLCKQNGWKAGTILRGKSHDRVDYIELTYISGQIMIAKKLRHHPEEMWTLQDREWVEDSTSK